MRILLVKDIPCECKFEAGSTVTVVTSMGEKASCKRKTSKGIQGIFHGIVLEETVIHLQQDSLQELYGYKDNTSPSKRNKHLLVLSLLRPSPPFMAGQIVWIMVDQITAINCEGQ